MGCKHFVCFLVVSTQKQTTYFLSFLWMAKVVKIVEYVLQCIKTKNWFVLSQRATSETDGELAKYRYTMKHEWLDNHNNPR